MSGVAYAVAAGIGFGIFQAVNRRANQEMDAYRATFLLLVVGTLSLSVWTAATQDLTLLAEAPLGSLAHFGAAGIVHFFLGWTFLALSQQRIGAASTGAVLASTPLVGSVLAALVLGEALTPVAVLGVLLVVAGVVLLSLRQNPGVMSRSVPWFALAAAFSWGSSPLFIRWGLEGLDSPLIGVTVGLLAATLAYAFALAVARRRRASQKPSRAGYAWASVAGVVVAICIAFQWIAFDLIPVAVAITLIQFSAPTIIAVAPFLVGSEAEHPTPTLILGAASILAGSILVVLAGTA